MIDFLNEYWGLAITLYVVLFVGNNYLTIVETKLHKAYVAQNITFQNGYELNPHFEKEVARFSWFTRKHLLTLLGGVISLSLFRWGSIAIFEFFIGASLLQWLYFNLSSLSQILYFQDIRKPDSLKGNIEYSFWLSQRGAARQRIIQAIFLSVAAIITMRLFFWGGVAAFLFQGFRGFNLSGRKVSQPNIAPPFKDR